MLENRLDQTRMDLVARIGLGDIQQAVGLMQDSSQHGLPAPHS